MVNVRQWAHALITEQAALKALSHHPPLGGVAKACNKRNDAVWIYSH